MEAKKIGAAIAKLREKKHMTESELAEHLRVSVERVRAWESGETKPSRKELGVMAGLFGVTVEELSVGLVSAHACEDGEEVKQIERDQDLFKLICRTIALAMGIAVTVLSILDRMDPKNAVAMLGIGLTCLGISSFHRKR